MNTGEMQNEVIEIPRKILEALAWEHLGGKARGACLYLISKGGARLDREGNPVTVSIPLKEWSHVLDCDKCYVTHLLNELIELDIIIRKNYLPGKVPEYFFNRRVDRWARRSVTLPKRIGRLGHGYKAS